MKFLLLPLIYVAICVFALVQYLATALFVIPQCRAGRMRIWLAATYLSWPIVAALSLYLSAMWGSARMVLPLFLLAYICIPIGVILQSVLIRGPKLREDVGLAKSASLISRSPLWNPILWGFIPTLCLAAILLIDYLGGRAGRPLSIPPLFPLGLVPFLVEWVAYITLAIMALLAIWRRKQILKHVAILGLALAVPYLGRKAVRALDIHPFLAGFQSSIFSAASPAEYRQAAITITETVPIGSYVGGPKKQNRPHEEGPTWEKLSSIPCIQKLDPWVVIIHREGFIKFEWGGALIGHWGFQIGSNPEKSTPDYPMLLVPYEPDFVFFMDPH